MEADIPKQGSRRAGNESFFITGGGEFSHVLDGWRVWFFEALIYLTLRKPIELSQYLVILYR